jgi:hypothetical protein
MTRNELPNVLFDKINMVEPYPNLVAPVISMINETAFFPGGQGLWLKNKSSSFPYILVLGQDFSTLKEYEKIRDNKSSDLNCPTWRNLILLFNKSNVNLNDCFFSNVFMGLRETESMVGKFPGFKDKKFVERNLEFLKFQIQTIRPKIIITLGIYAVNMISRLSKVDLKSWNLGKTFKSIDEYIKFEVNFESIQCTCIALVHPSMRHLNIKNIRYNEYIGNDAEIQMLREAMKKNN